MKTVLIVDDDKTFLLSLRDGFKAYEERFSIVTASNGIEAVAILVEQNINLVLTDLKMPGMDGFELVAHLSSHYPEVPVIVMTAFGTPEMEDNLKDLGAFQYIEKPIDFTSLVGKILKGLEDTSQGFITGVALTSFLQLLELDSKTCTLNIQSGSSKGIMYFKDGRLLDAITGDLSAKEAAFEIVSWKNVTIEIESSCSISKPQIVDPLGFILLEGSRRLDEKDAQEELQRGSDSLGDIDVGGLGLDLGAAADIYSDVASSTSPQASAKFADEENSQLKQLVTMLDSMPDIRRTVIVARDGSIVYQVSENDKEKASFMTYVSVASEQIQKTLGATKRRYAFFNREGGQNLLVLCGETIIVGLELARSTAPDEITKSLRPILNRIKL